MTTDNAPHAYHAVLPTPVAGVGLGLRFADDRLAAVDFLPAAARPHLPRSPGRRRTCQRLLDYLDDPSTPLALPLQVEGTPFQRRVWQALCHIPAGSTRSYGELARQLGSSARAVGGACRRNKIPLVIPCHRVVAESGPGGFMGQTAGNELAIKRWLLAHEQGFDER